MSAPMLSLVVAVSKNGVIGREGGLPWHISSDLKRFKEITMGKPVIMGRKTWESLPRKPLQGRKNIVVTGQKGFVAEGATVVGSPDDAIASASEENAEEICVIGGGEIYRQFFDRAQRLYLTEVDTVVAGDTEFPAVTNTDWIEVAREVHPKGPKDSASFVLRVLDRRT